jgi:hypothetical protein
MNTIYVFRAATAGKAPKALVALPRFWVSICSYKKQPVKKIWGRILGLAWLKFTVASLVLGTIHLRRRQIFKIFDPSPILSATI